MKILWLVPSLPWPTDSGGRQDIFYMLREFSRAGDEITLCALYHGKKPPEVPEEFDRLFKDVIFVPGNMKALHAQLLSSLTDEVPFKFRKYYSEEAVELVTGLLLDGEYDVLVAVPSHLMPLVLDCREKIRKAGGRIPPNVLRLHNVESNIVSKYAARINKPLIATFAKREARKMVAYEKAVLSEFDLVAAISPVDRDKLLEMSGGKANIISATTGANLEDLVPSETPQTPGEVVFVGSFDWHPNVDGAIWLIKKVWPRVLDKYPSAHLTLVGRKPPKELEAMDSETIELTGLVDSVREYIDRASVCAVPLWIGSGMRLKILEAFALRRAVVSTSLGAEGIEYEDGRNIVIRDKAEEFAEGIVDLLSNPGKAEKLGWNARALVEEKYGWDKVAVNFREEVSRLLQKKAD